MASAEQRQNVGVKASFTAIISDLHLCEAEPIHPRFPLWKKFKTKEFFFDDLFSDFLEMVEKKAGGAEVELVLNGDIFDFDSVTSIPDRPAFRVTHLERKRGLFPRPERSDYKIQTILEHHAQFIRSLSEFVKRGHRAVFVVGNHDVELHFPDVQERILKAMHLTEDERKRVRFCEWFYISNQDTLIEHGNQYDPYCVCEDPVHPFSRGYNYKTMRLPFGNLACRYILNGLGFFNPHVDTNYIMEVREYVRFFLKYMLRAQPLLLIDWLWGAVATMIMVLRERLYVPIRDPLHIENRVLEIAEKSNATPRMVRELKELFADSASHNPFMIARELWLDRAFLVMVAFAGILELFILVNQIFSLSFFWMFIPLFLLLPFFLFYSQSIQSLVSSFKEPDDRILATASRITKVQRIVYGHTHQIRHEMIGAVEHLNSGCWSPAFLDVECTRAIDQKTFVWIEPDQKIATAEGDLVEIRRASLLKFVDGTAQEVRVGTKSL